MAYKKFGSKSDAFQRQGQAWFCTTGLPSDITIEVGEMSFHLHKFPLLSRSRVLEKLITEQQSVGGEGECSINLPNVPGGSRSFELVAKFCYGAKIEMNASNVVFLRCAAEYLQMNEEVAEGNLISQTEAFLNQVVLLSWKDSLKALQICEDLLPHAEDLDIVKRCIDSLAVKACTDPKLHGWPIQSPDGSVLWNGISTGAIPTSRSSDWWYEDVSSLRLSTFKSLMAVMESRGIRAQLIAGSLSHYAKRYIHGLQKRHNPKAAPAAPAAEEEQRDLLEEIESLLPFKKGVASTKFLCGVLRTALILRARPACLSNLERRIGMQLDQATLEDLLMPTFSYSMETLYDVDCIQRILEHFLALDQAAAAAAAAAAGASPVLADDEHFIGSPSLTPITAVAKLIDGYLAEVAPDVNLKLPKFESLAAAVPEYARPLDDGLYRAVDVYFKGHPWLTEAEREQLCRLMDCQKLSLEACTHAAQNERLPLRVVVQVLFFEQLQLRSSIAGCFLVSDNLDGSRTLRSGTMAPCEGGGGWTGTVRENQVLKVGMDHMRSRVAELEKECSTMRQQIEKLGQGKNGWRSSVPKKLGFSFNFKSQMCSAWENSVSGEHHRSSAEKVERLQAKVVKPKRNKSTNE